MSNYLLPLITTTGKFSGHRIGHVWGQPPRVCVSVLSLLQGDAPPREQNAARCPRIKIQRPRRKNLSWSFLQWISRQQRMRSTEVDRRIPRKSAIEADASMRGSFISSSSLSSPSPALFVIVAARNKKSDPQKVAHSPPPLFALQCPF